MNILYSGLSKAREMLNFLYYCLQFLKYFKFLRSETLYYFCTQNNTNHVVIFTHSFKIINHSLKIIVI